MLGLAGFAQDHPACSWRHPVSPKAQAARIAANRGIRTHPGVTYLHPRDCMAPSLPFISLREPQQETALSPVEYPLNVAFVWSLSCVWLSCIPVDSSPPGSSVHGICQARIQEWVAIFFFSRRSSPSRAWTHVSCTADRLFTTGLPGRPHLSMYPLNYSCLPGEARQKQQSHFNKLQLTRCSWFLAATIDDDWTGMVLCAAHFISFLQHSRIMNIAGLRILMTRPRCLFPHIFLRAQPWESSGERRELQLTSRAILRLPLPFIVILCLI